jgi:hypothetical protein
VALAACTELLVIDSDGPHVHSVAEQLVGLAWSQDPNADITEKNTRDRNDQSQTATDQSNDPAGAHLLKR